MIIDLSTPELERTVLGDLRRCKKIFVYYTCAEDQSYINALCVLAYKGLAKQKHTHWRSDTYYELTDLGRTLVEKLILDENYERLKKGVTREHNRI